MADVQWDDEKGGKGPQVQWDTPAPSAWDRVGSALSAGVKSLSPSGIAEQVKADFGPAVEGFRNPKATTILPLALPGSGSVVSRVGGLAAGRVLDNPSSNPNYLENVGENLSTAGKGGAVGLAFEGVGGLLGKILRSLPGAKERIAATQAERTAGAMGEMSPGLAPGATVQDLRRAAVEAPKRLGAAKETAVQGVEKSLAGGQPGTFVPPGEIPMPSLGRYQTVGTVPRSPTRAVTQPSLEGGGVSVGTEQPITRGVYGEEVASLPSASFTSGRVVQRPTGERAFTGEGTQIDAAVPIGTTTSTMSLRDANAELSRIGDMLHGRAPLDPRYKDTNLAALYKQVAQDIERGIEQVGGPEAANAWRQLQSEYKAGRAVIKPFQTGSAYVPGQTAEEMRLNMPYLQRWLVNPKNEAYLRSKLLPEQFSALENALTNGGGVGSADVLAPGGRAMDALMEILRGKGGATQIPALVPRTLLPNFGSQYAGRTKPYTFPPRLQAVLDAAGTEPTVRAAERPLGR